MASFRDRVPQNVSGKFYVDAQCIYCDLCAEVAAAIFRELEGEGYAYVFEQPTSREGIKLAMEAVEGCPTESIGFDGDKNDWCVPPLVTGAILSESEMATYGEAPNQSTDPTPASGTPGAGHQPRHP